MQSFHFRVSLVWGLLAVVFIGGNDVAVGAADVDGGAGRHRKQDRVKFDVACALRISVPIIKKLFNAVKDYFLSAITYSSFPNIPFPAIYFVI